VLKGRPTAAEKVRRAVVAREERAAVEGVGVRGVRAEARAKRTGAARARGRAEARARRRAAARQSVAMGAERMGTATVMPMVVRGVR